MENPNPILASGYEFDIEKGIWSRPGYLSIAYSDGDEAENLIAKIIGNAGDLSVLSTELASHCSDWPTLYHLSRKRGNLLRPFEGYLCGKCVLEIGAGCGAITRYLGEIGADVLALEGSVRRASIAALRCQGLDNVAVVAEEFHHFKPLRRFDVVTCIGVLEYSRKFFSNGCADPVNAMLAAIKGLLKPGGQLILAIENQLGLKYFAGFPEDHVGKPMFGIEEHYSKESVVTFGRRDLGTRVGKVGLTVQQWWYPFPDYKLPSLMVSESGALPGDGVDLSSVVRGACISDPQYPQSISFNQERAWRPVVHNGLLSEMANSFVLLASDAPFSQQQNLPLALYYATDRRPEFAKKVVFKRSMDGAVTTHPVALCPCSVASLDSLIKQRLVDQPFIEGELWQDRLIQIMTSPGWTARQIQEWVKTWFGAFCAIAGVSDFENIADKKIPGKYLDAIPRNMFIDDNGAAIFIDQEWLFSKDLSVGYISFRALLISFSSIGMAAKPYEDKYLNVLHLLINATKCINIDLTESRVKEYLDLEGVLDRLTSGRQQTYSNEELAIWLASLKLRMFDTQTPVYEKLAQQDEQLAIVTQALAQRDKQLTEIFESTSWRATRPLRVFTKWLASL
jgi:2-polyprenyl-3-methyl-5-hydroxy-6-metoxy-1,4-benzoquinol methylase